VSIRVEPVDLRDSVGAWFTGRDPDARPRPVGAPGNLAHRRPHRPADLARDRRRVAEVVGVPADRWHLMRQVHGAAVGVVDAASPPGYELRDVDGAVTAEFDRPLVVQVADCVPVLFAGPGTVGVAHAGRRGVASGIVGEVVAALGALGDPPHSLVTAIGPAIRGCCYEVPSDLQAALAEVAPDAVATTTWGTPSLDLPAAVRSQLAAADVPVVTDVQSCTGCEPRWFSHRRDPDGGRQVGVIVRRVVPRHDAVEADDGDRVGAKAAP